MITQIDIVNRALAHINVSSITSINEPVTSARKAKLFYDVSRDSVLRDHDWSFANKTQYLDVLSNDEVPGWDYLYIYPSDCLHLRRIFQDGTVDYPIPEEFEILVTPNTNTKAIGAKIDQAYARYTMKVLDHSKFDSDFAEALSIYLASQLAQPLTGDIKIAQAMLALYTRKINDSKRVNMSEKSKTLKKTSSFIDAR